MKIFIISKQYSSPWSEGIRNLARRLALFLEKKQEDVSVLTEASHNLGEYGISIKTWRLPFIRQLSFIVKSALFIRQANPSVILLFSSCSSFLGLKTKLLKALCHCPVFVYVCGLHKWIGGYTWCYSADKTFVISPFLKEYFPNARIVYPWIPQHLRDYSSLDRAIEKGERNRVLFLGSFEKERGVEYLLEAISLLKSKLRVYLTLAWNGTGEERYKYITDLIKQLKIDDIVTIERQVDINRVYREYDLLVIPRVSSRKIALPLRIIEAITMKTPLVVSDICGMKEVIGECGLAAKPGDAESLERAIRTLLTDDRVYFECTQHCARKSKELESSKQLEIIYRELRNVSKGLL